MENLKNRVETVLTEIDEDLASIVSHQDKRREIIEKQIAKIRETALELYPIMEKIFRKGYFFINDKLKFKCAVGPILGYNKAKQELYVFSVSDKLPCIINLNSKENKNTTYNRLLEECSFEDLMDNLLIVLNSHKEILKGISEENERLELELNKYL